MFVAGCVHAPDGSGVPLAAVGVCHCGTLEQAEADLKPLLEFGSPVLSMIGPMPYEAVCQMLDDAYPRGGLNYWKSTFLSELSDGAIDTMVEQFASCPSPMTAMIVEHFHGEVTRVPVEATAVPHRAARLQPRHHRASGWIPRRRRRTSPGRARPTTRSRRSPRRAAG